MLILSSLFTCESWYVHVPADATESCDSVRCGQLRRFDRPRACCKWLHHVTPFTGGSLTPVSAWTAQIIRRILLGTWQSRSNDQIMFREIEITKPQPANQALTETVSHVTCKFSVVQPELSEGPSCKSKGPFAILKFCLKTIVLFY